MSGDFQVDWRALVNAWLIEQHNIQTRLDKGQVDDRTAAVQRVNSLRSALVRAEQAYAAAYDLPAPHFYDTDRIPLPKDKP